MRLYAGAGTGTICFPKELFPIEGFCGIHDNPVARVLVMECKEKAALVSLELVMLPSEYIEMVKDIIEKYTKTPKKNVWVHTTHAITTPHAPHAPIGMGGVPVEISEEDKVDLDKKTKIYADVVKNAVIEAARKAAETFESAAMGNAQAECKLSVNRDVETPLGWWIGKNPAGRTNAMYDVLRFDNGQGRCIAAVITGGLKPCAIDNSQMKENRRLISSDIPGFACRLIEKELDAPCLFFMGAAGDQVPVEQALYDEVQEDGTIKCIDLGVEEGLKIVERLGNQMVQDILPTIRELVCDRTEALIKVAETSMVWDGKGRLPMMPRKTVEFIKERDVEINGNILVLGDIALVGLKPEVNCITAQQLSEASPYEKTILMSMINGGQKYMPDAEAYQKITWEAQSSMMMVGAAEGWIQAVSNKLTELHT